MDSQHCNRYGLHSPSFDQPGWVKDSLAGNFINPWGFSLVQSLLLTWPTQLLSAHLPAQPSGPEPSTHPSPSSFVCSDPVFWSSIVKPMVLRGLIHRSTFSGVTVWVRCLTDTDIVAQSADLWNLLKFCCSLFNPLHAFCNLHMSMQKLDSRLKKDKGEFILEPNMIGHGPGIQTFISSNLIFQYGSSLVKLFIIKGQKKS